MGGQSRAVVEPGSGTSRDGAALIVDAGIELMSERGYHATSIRSIAKRAGMSTANLYHHFDSKQALLVQIMFGGIVRLRHDTDRARAEAGESAVDQLDAVVREHVVAHARRREVSFLTTSELRSLPGRERNRISRLFDEQQRCFDEVVALGIEQGLFSTPYPHDAARALASMCTAVAAWFVPGGPLSPEDVAERYVGFALSLVNAPDL